MDLSRSYTERENDSLPPSLRCIVPPLEVTFGIVKQNIYHLCVTIISSEPLIAVKQVPLTCALLCLHYLN